MKALKNPALWVGVVIMGWITACLVNVWWFWPLVIAVSVGAVITITAAVGPLPIVVGVLLAIGGAFTSWTELAVLSMIAGGIYAAFRVIVSDNPEGRRPKSHQKI
jgi:hypothetical protein